jgi:hypothetical protein
VKLIIQRRQYWLLRRQQIKDKGLRRIAGLERNRHFAWGGPKIKLQSVIRVQAPLMLLAEKEDYREKIWHCIASAAKALEKGHRVRFDFTKTTKAYPGGMLIFLAYVELLIDQYPSRISAISHQSSLITQLLEHFGFAERLQMQSRRRRPHHESVVNWRYLTGTLADGTKISELLTGYKEASGAKTPEGLYDVLAEALTNVRHHAYPETSTLPPALRRWWLFSRYDTPTAGESGNLYVSIYDIGVGIQESLRNKLKTSEIVLDKADKLLSVLPLGGLGVEKMLLTRAIEEERSGTGLGFRGNGLPEMLEFVEQTESGRLYIISGGAQYTRLAKNNKGGAYGCATVIPGTLIMWSIPLGFATQEVTK